MHRVLCCASSGWLLASLSLGASGCTKPPGDAIGTYRVEMTLTENTCGSEAVATEDGQTYKVQLRANGDRGYWRLPGQPPLEGSYDDGKFEFDYSSVVANSSPDAGPFCQLVQTEVRSGSVTLTSTQGSAADAGADIDASEALPTADVDAGPALVGTHVLTISAASGTDCSAALPPRGAYQALPCTVSYTLSGSPTHSF
jgi:hypothetical protein